MASNIRYQDRHSLILLIMANFYGNAAYNRRYNKKTVTTNENENASLI